MQQDSAGRNRIEIVDALRGFALLGILLMHSIEHFDFFWETAKTPEVFKPVDPFMERLIRFLFSGKAYSIFSLMFGFSFFIQMDRNRARGIDFKWRFLWRLTLLLCIGYIHSLMYDGDILSIYALLGIPLVFLFPLNKKVLLWISVIFVLQVPTIWNIVASCLNPDFELHRNLGSGLWPQAFDTYANGSFLDVIGFNAWNGHIAVWSWMYYNGRYLQLFGLFVMGLILGKARYFEHAEQHRRVTVIALVTGLLAFVVLAFVYRMLLGVGMPEVRLGLFRMLIKSYLDLTQTSVLVTGFILVYLSLHKRTKFRGLALYGRMSLTNYVCQSVCGVLFFYGYGLAMYPWFGPTMSVFYGILFFTLQIYLVRFWMGRFYYGPLEWTWRALTYMDFSLRFRRPAGS